MPLLETDDSIRKILETARKVAVFGITKDPNKPSNFVPKALKEKGFSLVGINPRYAGQQIEGIKVFGSLSEVSEEIDVVLVFRRPEDLPEIVNQAELKGFRTFWMQPGTVNEAVKEDLINKGYNVVARRCMKIEAERLLR
ncbi:MAG: CoA-binding protein [Desulfobacterota bacterium]|nr:CoA-binding protein [Thermodesulfobacteriota bacterium]MDW8001365.1 CoA-binding protein [Deltaproteobacteria bacterium]